MQMAPPSACETKAIVVVWKDPPFEPLFSTFVIYQCQRDYAGSLEDAERSDASWSHETVGGSATPRPPAATREDVFSRRKLQEISGQSCTATSGGLTSTKYFKNSLS